MPEIQGREIKPQHKLAVIASRFTPSIVDLLLGGTRRVFEEVGLIEGQDWDLIRVPGAYELPLASHLAIQNHDYAGVLTLGCVVRGETSHYDYVAGDCASGLMRVSLEHSRPVIFGVLTTENIEQAQVRAHWEQGNKGGYATRALLEMVDLSANWPKGQ